METKTIDRIGDGWLSQQPIYRTDLDRCTSRRRTCHGTTSASLAGR